MREFVMVGEDLPLISSKLGTAYSFILIVLLLLYFFQKKTATQIKQWQKSLNLQEHALIFQQLYHQVDGFMCSLQARKTQDAIEYVYGEIEFLSFIALLSLVQPNRDTIFYDLGSGTGKAVLACALVFPVHKSVGVELLPELYLSSCNQKTHLTTIQNYAEIAKKIEFIQGNFLAVDLKEATLIFINSTTMIGPIWEQLCARLNNLSQLNTVITTSKALISNNFIVIKTTNIQMSWGVVHAYIHTRKTNLN